MDNAFLIESNAHLIKSVEGAYSLFHTLMDRYVTLGEKHSETITAKAAITAELEKLRSVCAERAGNDQMQTERTIKLAVRYHNAKLALAALGTKYNDLNLAHSKLVDERRVLEAERAKLESAYNIELLKHSNLAAKTQTLTDDVTRLSSERDTFKAENGEIMAEHDKILDDYRKSAAKVQTLTARVDSLTRERDALMVERDTLKAECVKNREVISGFKSEVKRTNLLTDSTGESVIGHASCGF